MAIVLRVLAMLLVLVVAVVVVEQIAAESGEVVVLTTADEQTTRLWIVEIDGQPYLRAGMPQAGWYQRLLAEPNVRVQWAGVERAYTAVPELVRVPEVNRLMREKYGWADAYIGFLFGREESVPVRLDTAP